MDPIGPTTGPAAPVPGSPRSRRAAAGFAPPAEVPADETAIAEAAAALGPLLALQEAAAEPVADRQARQRGQALLAELVGLQRDLLAGAVNGARRAALRRLAADPPRARHAALQAAIDATVLRARIELARFGDS
jgi:hypothetical protein